MKVFTPHSLQRLKKPILTKSKNYFSRWRIKFYGSPEPKNTVVADLLRQHPSPTGSIHVGLDLARSDNKKALQYV
jgi:hypothetical protein